MDTRNMPHPRPIEIIGGGLSGLGLGLALRNRGVPVTVIESGTYPRHRVCGEFLTGLDPSAVQTLVLDDLLAPAITARTVTWYSSRDRPVTHRLPESALCLSRYTLDASMAARFCEMKGTLIAGKRADLTPRDGRIFCCGRRPNPKSSWIGLKQHYAGLDLTDDLEIHFGRNAYVGLTRIESGQVNVCGLFARSNKHEPSSDVMQTFLLQAGLPELSNRLRAARPLEESFCAVAGLDYRSEENPDDILRLGDAAGLIPPFTGHGMTIALQSAAVAAPILEKWSRGQQSWSETRVAADIQLRRCFRRRIAWARLLHPWLFRENRRRMVFAAARTGLLPFRRLYRLLH